MAERKEDKEPLDESERGEWKIGLKLNIQETKIMASGPITSQQIDGEKNGNSDRLYFLGLQKSQQMVTSPLKWKDTHSLEEKLQQT